MCVFGGWGSNAEPGCGYWGNKERDYINTRRNLDRSNSAWALTHQDKVAENLARSRLGFALKCWLVATDDGLQVRFSKSGENLNSLLWLPCRYFLVLSLRNLHKHN